MALTRFIGTITFFFLFLVIFVSIGCTGERSGGARIREPRYIVPNAGDGIALMGTQSIAQEERNESFDVLQSVRLSSIPDHYVVLDTIVHNLDEDESEEQIIVFKREDDPNDLIRILLADFEPLIGIYIHSWEGITTASNIGAFTIELLDITGDHRLEIACFGTSAMGDRTLDVFRRIDRTNSPIVLYTPVVSIQSNVSIEIMRIEREDAYTSFGLNGPGFPIVEYERASQGSYDTLSDSEQIEPETQLNILQNEDAAAQASSSAEGVAPLEALQETENSDTESQPALWRLVHTWDELTQRFNESEREMIPFAQVEEQQLAALFSANIKEFEQFVNRPWIHVDSADTGAFFDTVNEIITLFQSSAQKSYRWIRSYRTSTGGYPTLRIVMRNTTLETIIEQISITARTTDMISILLDNDTTWNGVYRALNDETSQDEDRSRAFNSDIRLQGLYRNESDFEIYFSEPRFTMRENDQERFGGFSLYKFGQHALELNVLDENGLSIEARVYRLEYDERTSNNRLVRTLRLTPAIIHVDGLHSISNLVINLEQIEELVTRPAEELEASGP